MNMKEFFAQRTNLFFHRPYLNFSEDRWNLLRRWNLRLDTTMEFFTSYVITASEIRTMQNNKPRLRIM